MAANGGTLVVSGPSLAKARVGRANRHAGRRGTLDALRGHRLLRGHFRDRDHQRWRERPAAGPSRRASGGAGTLTTGRSGLAETPRLASPSGPPRRARQRRHAHAGRRAQRHRRRRLRPGHLHALQLLRGPTNISLRPGRSLRLLLRLPGDRHPGAPQGRARPATAVELVEARRGHRRQRDPGHMGSRDRDPEPRLPRLPRRERNASGDQRASSRVRRLRAGFDPLAGRNYAFTDPTAAAALATGSRRSTSQGKSQWFGPVDVRRTRGAILARGRSLVAALVANPGEDAWSDPPGPRLAGGSAGSGPLVARPGPRGAVGRCRERRAR